MTDDTTNIIVLAIVGAGAALVYLATRAQAQLPDYQDVVDAVPNTPGNSIDSWIPVSEGGEVGVDVDTGVVYDDPETGPANDEPGDDQNTSFDTVNSNDTPVDDTDPETYAPDYESGQTGSAPSGGVLADPGTSQNYGDAPEQENDDLTERAANSNLSDSQKSAFDRLANYDDPSQL